MTGFNILEWRSSVISYDQTPLAKLRLSVPGEDDMSSSLQLNIEL